MQISFLLPLLVSGVGMYLLIKLRAFFIFHPIKTVKILTRSLRDRGARRSLMLALAGTLGVGNIFGVAAGLMIGGRGVVFWIFVSSFFSMVIKYAETLLVFDSDSREGMAGALSQIFPRLRRTVPPLYALLTVALALFMGAAIQSLALSDVAYATLSLDGRISSLVLFALLLPCLFGGGEKIESITEILIPLTTIIYILMCLSVIFLNFSEIPEVINSIFTDAFSPRAISGGAFFVAIKEGFARGILSNEAGVGTSALAHSRSSGRSPFVAGLFAMSEVFFDTTLLCTLGALAILLSGVDLSSYSTPMSLVSAAFTSSLGSLAGVILLFLILAFAYSTIICWYYYGRECTALYFPFLRMPFALLFSLFLLFAHLLSEDFLLYFTDLILFSMALMTLSAILKKRETIKELSRFHDI